MSGLNIDERPLNTQRPCELDFLSLGALVHRLDPGVIPFRKARSLEIHVSGGEYNVAANLSDCFGLKTGIARPWSTIRSERSCKAGCVKPG